LLPWDLSVIYLSHQGTYGSLAAFAFYIFLKPNTFSYSHVILFIPIELYLHYAERSFDVRTAGISSSMNFAVIFSQ
jgi:hypothetical protein